MKITRMLAVVSLCLGIISCSQAQKKSSETSSKPRQVQKTEAEWKKDLTPQQFYVLREKGTERPFSSPLNANKKKGTYVCAACQTPLFSSDTKFESGTGWPSFYKPLNTKNVEEEVDKTLGMVRTEVLCRVCGGHLGHVFDDGPAPTGLRYCLNGVSLAFKPKE
ncbi:peptide-methionine (R)-S-oxide reductase MsrB [Arundinibacter roseus]|uniref:Peptide methionine sulfoxide reductase MsrB n=1 Tax=Arundinibacter roseus TaxID=2070510 RepID=A0A4R4KM89_9BACT|nr:peptide-methionine (R)-S-oxide reductase MsrB [Arundinibacter roseus]TDB68136.1 peptide-methionine (R)-S-oxide reductase [Arundinibacter roseus]